MVSEEQRVKRKKPCHQPQISGNYYILLEEGNGEAIQDLK